MDYIERLLLSEAEVNTSGDPANVVDALFEIARVTV